MKRFFLTMALIMAGRATGIETDIYYCRGTAGKARLSIHLTLEEESGQYIASASSPRVGGTRTSGAVEVSKRVEKKIEIYSNEDEQFELRVLKKNFKDGEVSRVQVEGSFVDPSNRTKVRISRQWLKCYSPAM